VTDATTDATETIVARTVGTTAAERAQARAAG
jgi:hypothetical protein